MPLGQCLERILFVFLFLIFKVQRIPYVLVLSVPMSSKARDEPDEALADFKLI